jgi:hypothetical protein
VEIRFRRLIPISMVTPGIGLKGEVRTSELNRFASKGGKRILYYLMLLSLVFKSVSIIKRERVDAVASFGVGWVNDIAAMLVSCLTRRKLFTIFYHWPYEGYSAGQVLRSLRKEGRRFLPAAN